MFRQFFLGSRCSFEKLGPSCRAFIPLHLYMCTDHGGDRQCIVVADKERRRQSIVIHLEEKDLKGAFVRRHGLGFMA